MCIRDRWWSGFITSTSGDATMSFAVTSFGPFWSISSFCGSSPVYLRTKLLIFNIISLTSSNTPSIVENSCKTFSILILFTAAPGNKESNTLLNELPSVSP